MSARTLLVELHAENHNDELQPGAYAQVTFELPSDPNIVHVPTSALIFRERGTEIAVVGPDDKVELKPVKIGRNLGTQVEILSGLSPTDRVINSPPDSLGAGDKVRIAGQQSAAAIPEMPRRRATRTRRRARNQNSARTTSSVRRKPRSHCRKISVARPTLPNERGLSTGLAKYP